MGQKIIKRWFWRKKGTKRSVTPFDSEYANKWRDIAIRTVKTFVQVALGVVATAIANPPDAWKPAMTTAVASGVCAAMNYFIKQLEREVELYDIQTENDETGEGK